MASPHSDIPQCINSNEAEEMNQSEEKLQSHPCHMQMSCPLTLRHPHRTPWVPNGTGQRCMRRNVVPEPYSLGYWQNGSWARVRKQGVAHCRPMDLRTRRKRKLLFLEKVGTMVDIAFPRDRAVTFVARRAKSVAVRSSCINYGSVLPSCTCLSALAWWTCRKAMACRAETAWPAAL